jgi:hypothetical protein
LKTGLFVQELCLLGSDQRNLLLPTTRAKQVKLTALNFTTPSLPNTLSADCLWMATDNRPLHIQCSDPSRPLTKIVTLYEPDEDLWLNYKVRKQQNAG